MLVEFPVYRSVMSSKDIFSSYPARVQAGASYRRATGYYGVLDGEEVTIFKGEPEEGKTSKRIVPVYRLEPGGGMGVPTGLVFLRLAEGVDIEEHSQEINGAGYEVAERLSYAPNAAWLRAESGSIEDALDGLARLGSVPDVENFEPQMLMQSARR
jgi:hypothetical protein